MFMEKAGTILWRIFCMWRKELLDLLKNPANRIVLLAPVIVQSVVFGYAATYDLNDAPYALVDQSGGEAARELVARLDGSGLFRRVVTPVTPEGIAEAMDAGDILLGIQIGQDFDKRLSAGQDAPVQIILDGRNSTTAAVALSAVSTVIAEFNAARGAVPPLQLEWRAWFNPNLETRWNIMSGMIASLSLMQIMILAGLSIAREREEGTFDQLLVTPLTPTEILVGKAVPSVIIGILLSGVVLGICVFWFRIPLAGSVATILLCLAVFSLSSVGMGLCLSAVARNLQQAVVYAFVLLLPMFLLSGLASPVSSMPEALQIATYANPLRFALVCLRRVYLEGAGLADIAVNFIPMLAVATVTLPLAGWLFRNRS